MVTTRSADKRVDSMRGEDLVLRSRTVQSPTLSTPTPSQLRKRTTRERGQLDSPRAKRPRNGLDGAHDDEDVVPDSLDISQKESLEVSTDLDSTNEAPNRPSEGVLERTNLIGKPDSTPARKSTPQKKAAPSTIKSDAFTTPATSKHRRYNSEDLNEDTVIINQSTDSSAHNGYHTADEEFEESDDAPETASTKVPSVTPHRKRIRTPRSKKLARGSTVRNELSDEEGSIELQSAIDNANTAVQPSTQAASDSARKIEVREASSDPGLDVLDQLSDTGAVNNETRAATLEQQGLPLSTEERATDELDQRADGHLTDISNTVVASANLHILQQPQFSATSPSPTTPAISASLPQRIASSSSEATKELWLSKAAGNQSSKNPYPISSTSRLPNRAGKTLETFRRNQLDQRLPVESSWSKKRSAFAVS